MSNILITSIEHGVASVAHDIVVGAKKVTSVIAEIEKIAPEVESITALIDPRAAVIERIGAALIGELQPQVTAAAADAGDVATDAAAPSFSLSEDIVNELKSLYASLKSEISTVKSTIAGGATAAPVSGGVAKT